MFYLFIFLQLYDFVFSGTMVYVYMFTWVYLSHHCVFFSSVHLFQAFFTGILVQVQLDKVLLVAMVTLQRVFLAAITVYFRCVRSSLI